MTSWAKPGVKCVCVRVVGWRRNSGPPYAGPFPYLGGVYTINDIEAGEDGKIFLVLAEFGQRVRFWSDRFRPLATKTQEEDVAMFKLIAAKSPAHELTE